MRRTNSRDFTRNLPRICHIFPNLQQICHTYIHLYFITIMYICGRLADFSGKNSYEALLPHPQPLPSKGRGREAETTSPMVKRENSYNLELLGNKNSKEPRSKRRESGAFSMCSVEIQTLRSQGVKGGNRGQRESQGLLPPFGRAGEGLSPSPTGEGWGEAFSLPLGGLGRVCPPLPRERDGERLSPSP